VPPERRRSQSFSSREMLAPASAPLHAQSTRAHEKSRIPAENPGEGGRSSRADGGAVDGAALRRYPKGRSHAHSTRFTECF
jgi:hypothetical protein